MEVVSICNIADVMGRASLPRKRFRKTMPEYARKIIPGANTNPFHAKPATAKNNPAIVACVIEAF